MKIAVCIKQVPSSGNVQVDPSTHKLIRDNNEVEVNPSDLNAVTMALELKQACGAQVDIFTMGPPAAAKAIASCYAMGADDGYLLTDRSFGGSDTLGTARVLAAGMQSVGSYDLYLCGDISADGATGQVGPMLAQLLQLPSVSGVRLVETMQEDRIIVQRSCKGSTVRLGCKLPCLLTVGLGCNTPIRPTLRSQMKANKKPVAQIINETLSLSPGEVGLSAAKSVVTSTYSPEINGHHAVMLTGSAAEVAAQVIGLIAKEEAKR